MKGFSKKRVIGIIAILMLVLITILTIFAMPQNAAEINRCKIKVVDDGSTHKKQNNEIAVTQKIVNAKDKELTFQVDIENYQYKRTQIGIVIDNSYSMWSDNKLVNSKEAIVKLINKIFDEISNSEVALYTNNGTKLAMGANKEDLITQINNISSYEGIVAKTGLTYAKDGFTDENANKYIILYTDGQENLTEEINNIKEKEITLLTAYYGNDSYVYNKYEKAGQVYKIPTLSENNFDTFNSSITTKIKNAMKKEVNNLKIENSFSSDIKNNFTYELIQNPTIGSITPTSTGYTWTINKLDKDSASFKYKLTLKNNLDRNIMYKDISTNSNMTVIYKNSQTGENNSLENNYSPKINIEETYTLKVKAINKKYTGVNARNIEFKIEQIDASGNIVRTEQKTTNSDGEIILDDITQNGSYTFRITQISTPTEYELSNESKRVKSLQINKDYLSNNINATTNDSDDIFEINTDNNDKIVTATIKMDPKEFILKLNKIDEEYKNSISNIDFSVLEPTSNSIPQGTKITGRSNSSGIAVFTAEVAGNGTYTYTINELSTPTGYYENKEDMKINITFNEQGVPTSVSSNSKNIKIDEDAVQQDVININVTNKMLDYTLQINAFNEKYKNMKINNVKVQIEGKDESGHVVYSKEETTNNGKIELKINKSGKITYTIKQISAPVEYNLTEDVSYVLTRNFNDNELILNLPTDNEDIVLDNNNKVLNVNIYLEQRTFEFKLNKVDKEDNSKKLDGAKVQLQQPASRDKLEETTENGCLSYTADVVGNINNGDNTYSSIYYLYELQKPQGYEKLNNSFGVKVTFDTNGKVIDAISLNEEYVNIIENTSEVEVNLKNKLQEYNVELVTVNKKYENVIIPGVNLDLTMTEGTNTLLPKTTYTTDENGVISLQDFSKDGEIKFDIEEKYAPTGYLPNDETAYFSYDYESESLKPLNNSSENIKIITDNKNGKVTIKILIEPQTFNLEISKKSSVLGDTLIEGAKFELYQPNIENIRREVLQGETKQDESLIISAEVGGEGTYQYILRELKAPNGYEFNNIYEKLNITFDSNGNIINIIGEETNNTKPNYQADESNDFIATTTEKNYVTVGNVTKKDGLDLVPITIENDQEEVNLEITVLHDTYRGYPIQNAEVNIIGKTSNGQFYNKTLKTDSYGKIRITRIDNIGDFDFSAIATSVPTGYIAQETATTAYINKSEQNTNLTERIDSENVSIGNKKINMYLYIKPQTFNVEISKYEQALGNLLIPNVTFKMTQPNLTKMIARKTITGITAKGEKLVLEGEVVGEGTYEYRVKEYAPSGYEDKNIDFTLSITFNENGEIVGVEKNIGETAIDDITLNTYTYNTIPITIMNYQKPYNITVELTNKKYGDKYDKNGNKIPGVKVENAKIRVIGKVNGNIVYNSDNIYPNGMYTNGVGQAVFSPLTTRGDVTYEVEILEVPTGYILPEDSKITFELNKDEITTEMTLKEDVEGVTVIDGSKLILVEKSIDVQTFEIDINKKDKDESNLLLEGATFTLTQPRFIENEREGRVRNNVSGRTELNETLSLEGEVAGEGVYTYKLNENAPSGYTANNPETELKIEFNKDGTVKNVTCLSNEEDAYINTDNSNSQKITVDIINTKKPYTINVRALNSKHTSYSVEGLKLKIIGKDSNGNKVYESEDLITNASGSVSISNLKTTGDVTYEIEQLEDAPAAYILGDKKYVYLNINKQNNVITNRNVQDKDVIVNDGSKNINVTLYIQPKTFTITVDKLEYDDKLKGNNTLIEGANFQLTGPRYSTASGVTEEGKKLNLTAEVAGEGTYRYQLWETWPSGYQEFYAKIFLDITFDEHGNIIEEVDGNKPVNLTYEWWTWGINEHGRFLSKIDNNKGIISLVGNTENSVECLVTNVKKEYSLVINTIDDKYEEPVDGVKLKITAKTESGETLFEGIRTTQGGKVTIPEFRYVGKVYFEIEEASIPTQFTHFENKKITIVKEFPQITANIDWNNTSTDINAKVTYADIFGAKGPINSPTTISATIMLHRKTFDINLTKVDIDNNKIFLPNATFALTQYDGKHVQTETTDEDGTLKLSADIEGIEEDAQNNEKESLYILKETGVPAGYNLTTTEVKIYVTLNKQDEITNVRITNGSSFVQENQENRTKESIDLLSRNAKSGILYNIQLTKKYNHIPVVGSTYKITIDAESGENLTIKDITDNNGQILATKIPGNRKIRIKLNEIKAPIGYSLDTREKIVTVYRNVSTGKIEILESETSDDVVATYNEETKTIYIEIDEEEPKPQDNIFRILSVDKNDEIKAVTYADLQIIPPEGQEIINTTTDNNGRVTLNSILAPGVGTYTYTIKVLKTPNGYLDFQGGDVNVNITFDENKNIVETVLANENDYANAYYSNDEDNSKFYNIANAVVKNIPKETIKLNLLKKGENDSNLQNVEYSIVTSTLIDGGETATSTKKITDNSGRFNCDVLSGDKVEITLKEIKTHEAYKLDNIARNIVIEKVNGVLQLNENKTSNDIEVAFENGEINVIQKNNYKPAKVIMQYVYEDSDGNAIKLRNINVKVKEISSGKEYDLTTDEAGELNFNDLPVENAGTYEFVITQMTTIVGDILQDINQTNPAKIIVNYVRTEEGDLTVIDPIEYSSPNEIIKGVSYTKYSAPEEYRLFLRVVLSDAVLGNDPDGPDDPDDPEDPEEPDEPEEKTYRFLLEIDKLDKDTQEPMEYVEFKVANLDKITKEQVGEEAVGYTDDEGGVQFNIKGVKANNEYLYKLTETTPTGYKSIDDIKVKVNIGEDGKVATIEQINENIAVKETKVEDNIAKVIVENEKEISEPEEPEKEYEYILEIDKLDKLTQKVMGNVEFTIVQIDEDTEEDKSQRVTFKTNEDGIIQSRITKVKANRDYIYKIVENTPEGYKQVNDIKVKIHIGEDGKVSNIKLLENNLAVKDVKIEDNIAKVIVENEKEELNPESPENPEDPEEPEEPMEPENPKTPEEPETPDIPEKPETSIENKPESPEPVSPIIKTIKNTINKIPYTGARNLLVVLIVAFGTTAIVIYIKYKKIENK